MSTLQSQGHGHAFEAQIQLCLREDNDLLAEQYTSKFDIPLCAHFNLPVSIKTCKGIK